MTPALTIFYNTHCPVCDAGISYQRGKMIALLKRGLIAFQDINLEPEALAAHNILLEDIRRRLHALRDDGELLIGADVVVAVWRMTPGQNWIAALLGNSMILPFTRFGYNQFANLLYTWNRWMGHW